MRILIAEDEAIIARDIKGIVERFGHTVVGVVDTVQDVLETVATAQVDIVLLDIHLRGERDGISAGQALHDTFHVPVVYLTAHADPDTVRRAAATEPFGYLLKPFSEQALQSTLEVAHYKHLMERRLLEHNRQLRTAVDALTQRTTEVTVLSTLGGELLRSSAIEECYAVIAKATRRLFPDADGTLYIQRGAAPMAEAVAVWGSSAERLPRLTPETCWALNRHQVLSDVACDLRCPCASAPPDVLHWTLCVPLVVDAGSSGVLHMRLPRVADPLLADASNAARTQLAITLAEQAALGLTNVRMRILLREQAIRDPLTGLFNRRYLEETLTRELHRAARNRYPVGVIMLDIDHFKQINDTYGHEAGDTVLRTLGALLGGMVRAGDVACRYGGEEFVLILPAAPREVVADRAEAIRRAASALAIPHRDQVLPPITVSLGTSLVADAQASVTEALARADAALYAAKRAGRNRVVAHASVIPPTV